MNRTFLILAVTIMAACSNAGRSNAAPQAATSVFTAETELPLPAIPDSLRQPAQRATYILAHFWDALDFTDTATTHIEPFMERNFVNFVNLYPHAIPDSLPSITASFLQRATADTPTRLFVYSLIDKYLSEPESPVFSDDAYITFLSEWTKLKLDPYELEEPRYRLAAALKNRPGTRAADFVYRTASGSSSTLHKTMAPALLMVLYDPDCDHCMEVITSLRHNADLNSLISDGRLEVLAVYVESDPALWQSTASTMPENWTVGTDLTGILDKELYDIPTMPGLYLLSADKTVLLRQPTLESLRSALPSLK